MSFKGLTLDPVLPEPNAAELLFECRDEVKMTVQVNSSPRDKVGQHLREKLEGGHGNKDDKAAVLATTDGLFLQAGTKVFIPYSAIVLHSVGKGKVYCQVEISEYKPSPTNKALPVTSTDENETDDSSVAEDEPPLLIEIYLDFVHCDTAKQFYNLLSSQSSASQDDDSVSSD